jgi:hypothetical protein
LLIRPILHDLGEPVDGNQVMKRLDSPRAHASTDSSE